MSADGTKVREAEMNAVLARLPHGGTKWCSADLPAGCEHCVKTAEAILAAVSRPAEARGCFDLLAFLRRQRALSERAFGPLERKHGVVDHIRKELVEIESAPRDLEEWIDVVLLALDGAWRCDKSPEEIAAMLEAKLAKNEARDWPDFRTIPEGKAIEHVRAALAAREGA